MATLSCGTTQFDPVSGGTTTLAVGAPAGFETPDTASQYYYHASLTVDVVAPKICLSNYGCNASNVTLQVGEDLQAWMPVYLESAPEAPVTITATSAAVRWHWCRRARRVRAQSSATVANVANTSRRDLWVHGLAQGQSTQVTLSAPGYAEPGDRCRRGSVGVCAVSATTRSSAFTTNSSAANTALSLYAVRLNADLTAG